MKQDNEHYKALIHKATQATGVSDHDVYLTFRVDGWDAYISMPPKRRCRTQVQCTNRGVAVSPEDAMNGAIEDALFSRKNGFCGGAV